MVADTQSLRMIAERVERRIDLDSALLEAIRSARRADGSWSEIGAMLGVSKQAAQKEVLEDRRLTQATFASSRPAPIRRSVTPSGLSAWGLRCWLPAR